MPKIGIEIAGVDRKVLDGISKAAKTHNVDFSFLMAEAARESRFNNTAKAANSSAAGLYQFIEQTWLGVFKEHGGEIGQGKLAASIQVDNKGRFYVPNAHQREQILSLRRDAEVSSHLAAAHAADNREILGDALNREIKPTDLYLAHFLGAAGAERFLTALKEDGKQKAAELFPTEARNNRAVFFDKTGKPKALNQIYASLDKGIATDMAQYVQFQPSAGSNSRPAPQTIPVSIDNHAVASLDARTWTQLHAQKPDDRRYIQALELASAPFLS